MIGKLKGSLIEVENNIGLVETSGGVFYNVFLTPKVLATKLPSPIEIYTYLQVRDDALVLFGFESKNQYREFVLLLSVPGVGPKTAFSIISFTKSSDFIDAIKANDVNYFTRIPGLGKKTAMKIILELSQKMHQDFAFGKMQLSDEDKLVIDALVALGFKSNDASKLLQSIPQNLSVEEKIKKALQLGSTKNRV